MLDVFNENNKPDLEKAIIKTIAFFDLFDFPPTAREISTCLNDEFSLHNIIEVADNSLLIKFARGYYFLPGRAEIINTRQKRYNYYCRKLKIAHRFARLFSFLPAVEVVCLANVIGPHNLRDESDIDFFIITSQGKIWQTRLYCSGLVAILNKRPTNKNKRDKICLSFYVSSDRLCLNDVKLKPIDPYFEHWLHYLVLLYNKNNTYNNFLMINGLLTGDLKIKDVNHESGQKTYQSPVGKIEKLARFFQLIIMNPALQEAALNKNGVVINNQILKLYLKDSRQKYLQKYGNKLEQIFTKNN